MIKKLFFICAAVFICAGACFSREPEFVAPGAKAPDFKIKDQYDNTYELKTLKKSLFAIVYADRDTAAAGDDWLQRLDRRYNAEEDEDGNPIVRVRLLRAVYLADVPPLVRPKVEEFFLPEDKKEKQPPILLDWSGLLADGFGYAPAAAHVYAVAPGGVVVWAGAIRDGKDEESLLKNLDGYIAGPED